MFTSKYRYLFVVSLAGYSYLNSLFTEVYGYYHIEAKWYYTLAFFFIITLFVWESNRLLQKLLNKYSANQSTARFLIIFFLSGMLLSSLLSVATVAGFNAAFLHWPTGQLKIPMKLSLTYGTRINLFLHILNAILFYVEKYKNKQLETEELKRVNSQAQLQAIKQQVNPHFLFNNLNVLSALVMKESPDANKFIEEFSKVYRHVLSAQEQELMTLQAELDFLNPYVFLLQKRFPESIFIRTEIEQEYFSYLIIPVALQMLIENAIKHNIASRQKPLQISLSIDHQKMLKVTNNLQLKPAVDASTQIGLHNIAKRYELVTGKQIEIENTSDHFSVSLPLIKPES